VPETQELFADVFSYVLLFEQMSQQENFQPSYEEVHETMDRLLAQADATAGQHGIPAPDYQEARFAVVAWADEVFLNHAAWTHRDRWDERPLQERYYGTRRGGQEFFDHLERLRHEQRGAREIYHRCLTLGFGGQYWDDVPHLHGIRLAQAQQLGVATENGHSNPKLAPQVYEGSEVTHGMPTPHWTERLRPIARALLVAMPLMVFVIALISSLGGGRDVKPPLVQQPPKQVPTPRPQGLAVRINTALGPYQNQGECYTMSWSVDEQQGVVTLRGRIESDAKRTTIHQAVQREPGVTRIDQDQLRVVYQPFCEVVELLEAYQQGQSTGAVLRLIKKQNNGAPVMVSEGNPLYYDGENLIIEVATPQSFPRYVYVDYYYTQEDVAHFFPNPYETDNFKQPGVTFRIGDRPDLPLIVGPPHGQVLVTVITSKSALSSTPRFAGGKSEEAYKEPRRAYLEKLRKALQEVPQANVDVAFHFMQTRPKPE
jgi:type VI secretion system protein ImpK